MADKDESDFEDVLVEHLEHEYGEDNVHRQVYLDEIERYSGTTKKFCDIHVEGPLVDYAIEVESNFESCWKGKTQAEIYAKMLDNAVPVLVVKEGNIEEPDASMLREDIQLVEVDL